MTWLRYIPCRCISNIHELWRIERKTLSRLLVWKDHQTRPSLCQVGLVGLGWVSLWIIFRARKETWLREGTITITIMIRIGFA